MDDLVKRLRGGTDVGILTPVGELCVEAADEIESLRAELEAVKKDAERYRWLRDGPDPLSVREVFGTWVAMDHGTLDAAIDAAMKESQ